MKLSRCVVIGFDIKKEHGKVMKTIKAGKFDGFAAFIRLKWTGTEFVRSEAE